MSVIKVALVDDHQILARALAKLINGFDDFSVDIVSDKGDELLKSMQSLGGGGLLLSFLC